MTISFSGLASGLDTTSWIESLVALRRAKVTTLQQERENVLISKDTLSSIKTFFNSFRSTIERITDTKFNIVSMDLFAQNIATSANLNVLTATATSDAEEGTYRVKVDKLASKTNAASNYKYTTTIVETTTATSGTKLIDLDVQDADGNVIGKVKTGTITVSDGVNVSNINITQNDTIATFVEKLQGAGVQATYSEKTGVFTINANSDAIVDTDNTGIKGALHLKDVDEGYQTQESLKVKEVENIWSPVDNDTKLSELGVSAGTLVISANDAEYDVSIDENTSFGDLISALNDNNIDASLDSNGVFTLNDAVIIEAETTTNFVEKLGLESSIYSKSQATGVLSHETTITETTTATSATLLKDIGEGTAIADDSTVIVKNSNNEFTTITVGTASTIGNLLDEMSDAGLYATINSDGTVEISGGAITGGTFDAVSALGLQTEPYSAMVTGNSLTETVINEEIVTLDTRLVEDLGATEGYLEITDASGNIYYEKISSGQTISDFIATLNNHGISASLNQDTGVLTINGGAFRTLDNANNEAGSLIADGTIVETDPSFPAVGTNLLSCLYGSDVISTDQIEVSSVYSKTQALKYSSTSIVNAGTNSTLESIGLTTDGTALFDVRGNTVTLEVTGLMTIQELMDELTAQGIQASWDESNAKLTINNATLTGGTSDLSDALNMTETIVGKYVTSDALFATNEYVSNATRDSLLSVYGINSTETVTLYREDGTSDTFDIDGNTSLGTLIDTLNTMGVTATLSDGVFSIDGGYLENTSLETALDLKRVVNGQTHILGNEVTYTVTTAVTGTSKLGEIIAALGTTGAVSGGYDLSFNSTTLSVSESTTVNELAEQINALGGTVSLDSTGKLFINGGTLSGTVATALGFTAKSITAGVSTTGETLTTLSTINADKTTTLSELGIETAEINIHNSDGTTVSSLATTGSMTIEEVFNQLLPTGITGSIEDGVITFTSSNGRYISGSFADAVGISTVNTDTVITAGTSVTSTAPITFTQSVYADGTTTLKELGVLTEGAHLTKAEAEALGYTWVTTRAELTSALSGSTAATKVMLGCDIDLSSAAWTPIATFKGTFDGNNYSISGMNIVDNTQQYTGFFTEIDSGGRVKNLNFVNSNINIEETSTIGKYIGVLAGKAYKANIDNVSVSNANITTNNSTTGGYFVGGIVGNLHSSTIKSSDVIDLTTNLTGNGTMRIGGIAGVGNQGLISQSKVDGLNITAISASGTIEAGGIIGRSSYDKIFQAETVIDSINITSATNNSGVVAGRTMSSNSNYFYADEVYYTDNTGTLAPFGAIADSSIIKDVRSGALPVNTSDLAVYSADGSLLGTVAVNETSTINDVLSGLLNYGINGTINNGQIVLNSPNGAYVLGSVATQLGITTGTPITVSTIGAATSSTAAVMFTQETNATASDRIYDFVGIKLEECDGTLTASEITGNTIAISTAEDLANLSAAVAAGVDTTGKTFVLMNDIDLDSYENWVSIGSGGYSFKGTFDGNYHTISNLTQTSRVGIGSPDFAAGLFGKVENATIKNLNLDSAELNVTQEVQYAGALAGYASETNIENVTITNLNASFNAAGTSGALCAGGAVGVLSGYYNTIKGIKVSGEIFNLNYGSATGGIFGSVVASETSIEYLHSDVDITGCSYGTVGGIAGKFTHNQGENIIQYSSSIGKSSSSNAGSIGGLFGELTLNGSATYYIKDCYSSDYSGDTSFGGLIHTVYNDYGFVIKNCGFTTYSSYYTNTGTGAITEDNVYKTTLSINNKFNDSPHWIAYNSSPSYNTGPVADEADLLIKNSSGELINGIHNVENMTFQELFTTLESYGITCTLSDGVITINSSNGNYVDGEIWENLGFSVLSTTNTVTTTTPLSISSASAVTYTTSVIADTTTALGATKYAINGTITASGVTGTVIGISTVEDLQNLANLVKGGSTMSGKTFVLMNDIDLSGVSNWTEIGTKSYNFMGTFDGMGHTISNFNQNVTVSTGSTDVGKGFFGHVYNATIKNIKFTDATLYATVVPGVTTSSVVRAGFIGQSYNSTISGVQVVNADFTGGGNVSLAGIVGYSSGKTTITNSSTSGTISNTGGTTAGILSYCSVDGNTIDTVQNDAFILAREDHVVGFGGIIGCVYTGNSPGVGVINIKNVLNKGSVICENTAADSYSAAIIGAIKNSTNSYGYTINVENTVNLGLVNATSAADVVHFWSSTVTPHSATKININSFYGLATSTTSTDAFICNDDSTATEGFVSAMNSAVSSTSKRNLGVAVLSNSIRSAATSFDTSVWSANTTVAGINLKIGDEYDIFVCGNTGIVTKTINLSATNTMQDVITALSAYGEASMSNGVISFAPNSSTITIDGTGEQFVNSATALYEKVFYTLNENTTLAEIGLPDINNGYVIGVVDDTGNDATITMYGDQTVGNMMNQLSAYGFACSILDGKLSITPTNNAYISSMANLMRSRLKFTTGVGAGVSYTTNVSSTTVYAGSTTSSRQSVKVSSNITSSTKLSEVGLTANGEMTIMSNGTENIVTLSPDQTIGDMITTLAGYNISASVVDGKFTVQASEKAYISGLDTDLTDGLKIADVSELYRESADIVIGNTTSGTLMHTTTSTLSTSNTIDSLRSGASGTIQVYQNGNTHTVGVNNQDTIADVFTKLSTYGIYGSVADGKITLQGNNNTYITEMSADIADIFGLTDLDTYTETNSVIVSNTVSNTLKDTQTIVATDTCQLQNLKLSSDGSAPTGYDFVLSTTTNTGTTLTTVTFSATATLDDVINHLASNGIQASVTTGGKLKLWSETLSDFEISGALGEYLMGSYVKTYNESSVNNTSTLLSAATSVKMDSGTVLSDIGITDGALEIIQNEVTKTINIDSTSTVGDFRLQLAALGITGDVINGKLALNATGTLEFATPADGSNIVSVLGLDNTGTLSDYSQSSKKLSASGSSDGVASLQTKISEIKDSEGNYLGITDGQIYVYQDGTRSLINIDTNETLESLATKLSQYGITMGISSDGKLYFDGNNNSYLTTDGLSSGVASNILTKLNIDNNWLTRYNSTSETLQQENIQDVTVDGSAKLVDLKKSNGYSLNITEGAYYVYHNGVRYTETITANTTVNDLFATLSNYGISASITEGGVISVRADSNTYLAAADTAGSNTNAIDVLFDEWNFVNVYSSNALRTQEEEIVAINENTKLADINGSNYEAGYITVVKDGVQTNIELLEDDTVGDLMEKLSLYGFESIVNSNGELIIKNSGDSSLQSYTGADTASNALDILGVNSGSWINTNTYESNTVTVVTTTTEDISATRDTLLSDLGVDKTGEYYIYKNGVKYTALISTDETLGSLMNTLESFGIQTSLVDDGSGPILSIIGSGDSYLATSSSETNASNVVDVLFTTSDASHSYTAQNEVYVTVTNWATATEDILLSTYDNGLLVSQGDLSVTVDGVAKTISLTGTETIGSFVEKLQDAGMEAAYINGNILISKGSINAAGTTSSVAANLKIVYNNAIDGYCTSSATVENTTSTVEEKTVSVANYADYSTKLNLLNISSGSLTVYRNGEKAIIQVDSEKTFGDLRTQIASEFADVDIKFEDGYLTFYSTSGAKVEVGSTTDTSNFSAITGASKDGDGVVKSARELYCVNSSSIITTAGIFRDGNVREGTFRIGDADFTITNTTTISDIVNQINASQDANATAYWDSVDAKLVIQSRTTGSALVNIEAGTSNFTDVMGLTSESEWTSTSVDLATVNDDKDTLSSLGISIGTIELKKEAGANNTIESKTITISDSTTIKDFINEINNTGFVDATWDKTNKRIVFDIDDNDKVNFVTGTSNANEVLGLTTTRLGDKDNDGNADVANVKSKINVDNQVIGDNARFSINGTYYTSTSNTIGSDVSRIEGLTINLKGISDGETTITVEKDKTSLANAVSDVVDAYNELIENVDKEIAKGAPLDDQFALKLLRNQIRSLMTGSIATAGVFKNLDAIGISLDKASANNINTENIDKLSFDKDKFIKAFDADRDALKSILVGTNTSKGIFEQVESLVESAVGSSYGFFTSAEKSYNTQISRLDSKIEKAQSAVDRYKERLEAKFASMDLLISQMQNQYSSFLGV